MLRKTTRRVTPVSGRTVYPGGTMTAEACQRELGLGREMLRMARRAGVKFSRRGKRMYYSSTDLLNWIWSTDLQEAD